MRLIFAFLGILWSICLCAAEPSVSSLDDRVTQLLKTEAAITLSVESCLPQRRITDLMVEIDKIGQELMKREQTDEIIAQSEKCLAALAVLRERRVLAYMLWAEGCLEKASSGRYADLSALDQHTLMALYGKLSEINISIIRENMLSREIMERLSKIYDCLKPDNKRRVRVRAIFQQRDVLSNTVNIPRRKTLDDF